MSQRNPMNERYQQDLKGQTKKSAASAKPKSKAAASVYVKPDTKSPQEKKAARKEARKKQAELDRLYYNPPTPEYKRLRRLWWGLLIVACACTLLAMVVGNFVAAPEPVMWAFLIPAYACIIAAIWLDFSKIRKVRQAYQNEMMRKHPKDVKKAIEVVQGGSKQEPESKKKPEKRFGHLFGKKSEEQANEEAGAKKVTEEAGAAAEAAAKAEEDKTKTIAQLKAERAAAKAAAEKEAQEAQDSVEQA